MVHQKENMIQKKKKTRKFRVTFNVVVGMYKEAFVIHKKIHQKKKKRYSELMAKL